MNAVANGERPANAVRRYEVSAADLPIRCPVSGSTEWNSHPQVYLRLDASGKARCPYCSAEFVLKQ